MKATFQELFDEVFNAPKPRCYLMPVGDSLKKALARHEWKERNRAQRILSRPPKFAHRIP